MAHLHDLLFTFPNLRDGDYIVLNGGIRGGTYDVHIRVYPVRYGSFSKL